jgi:hypothetical protein
MKLIVGYFALIAVLLVSLSVFASRDANAETEAVEQPASPTLQTMSSDRLQAEDAAPVVEAYVI